MKPYCILLAVLWAVSVLTGIWGLTSAPHPYIAIKSLGDVVLFSLCLAGCFQQAWGRTLVRFSAAQWRLTYQATLALGVFYVILKNYGEMLGVPTFSGPANLMQVGLDFLPYVLFAVPVIVLNHDLQNQA